MLSPSTHTQRPSRAERSQNRGSAYSSGSDTSTDATAMDSEMHPAVKRPRYSHRAGRNAEQEPCGMNADTRFESELGIVGIRKRAPQLKKTYGKAIRKQMVEEAAPQGNSSAMPLDEVFPSSKVTSLPFRKSNISDASTAPTSNVENTPLSSPITSPPSAQSSRSPPAALSQAPPLFTIHHASSPHAENPPSPVPSVPHPATPAPPVATLAPPAVSTRSDWSKRKLEGKPGLRVIGRKPAVITRKQTAAEKLAAATAAAKKEKEEAEALAARIAERFIRISLTVNIHGDPCTTISVSHSSSHFPIHPSRAERTPALTSLRYTFNHTDTSILIINLASNVIRVPNEISAPYLEEEETPKSEWELEIWDGRAAWKV